MTVKTQRRGYDVEFAYILYYKYPAEMGTAEIMQIFGIKRGIAGRIKKGVRALMAEQDKKPCRYGKVDTKCLYEYTEIDMSEVKKCYKELEKLGLLRSQQNAEKPKLEVLKGAAQ